jgi:hypothetical protein
MKQKHIVLSENKKGTNEDPLLPSEFITLSRVHLKVPKIDLYTVLDAFYPTMKEIGDYITTLDGTGNLTPSDFLESSFSIQQYDKQGMPIKDKDQLVNKSSLDLLGYGEHITNDNLILLNKASRVIEAINLALSQLNKLETQIIKPHSKETASCFAEVKKLIQNVVIIAEETEIFKIIPDSNRVTQNLKVLRALDSVAPDNVGNSNTFKNRLLANKNPQSDTHAPSGISNPPT